MTTTTSLDTDRLRAWLDAFRDQTGANAVDARVVKGTAVFVTADEIEQLIQASEALADIKERFENAVANLREKLHRVPGDIENHAERARLNGKIEGVKLALSYIDEAIRGIS